VPRWFDLVVVLTTDNTILYDRLEKRGYSERKISENIECEIMNVIVEEARESYRWCQTVLHQVCLLLSANSVESIFMIPPHFLLACREEIVQVLPSNTIDDIEGNVEQIVAWIRQAVQR
jgi:DNA-binding MarR family transcriptional regulator